MQSVAKGLSLTAVSAIVFGLSLAVALLVSRSGGLVEVRSPASLSDFTSTELHLKKSRRYVITAAATGPPFIECLLGATSPISGSCDGHKPALNANWQVVSRFGPLMQSATNRDSSEFSYTGHRVERVLGYLFSDSNQVAVLRFHYNSSAKSLAPYHLTIEVRAIDNPTGDLDFALGLLMLFCIAAAAFGVFSAIVAVVNNKRSAPLK